MASCSTKGFSWSKQQRERGNMFYRSATGDFGTTIKISRLENALTCYKNALSCSENEDEEEVSAAKNIAMASWNLAALYVDIDSDLDTKVSFLLFTYDSIFGTHPFLCHENEYV